MDYTIYIILAGLASIYFLTMGLNKKRSRERKSRGFMDEYRKDINKRTTKEPKK